VKLDLDCKRLLARAAEDTGALVFLTGAGVSAESGIPTFRGAEGYWQIGSRNFQPMELATRAAFDQMPEEIWAWYLHRRAICHAAAPNLAHAALSGAEQRWGDRFLLITQNVDGLHLRAGNSGARMYQIHGNLDGCRCVNDCAAGADPQPLPLGFAQGWERARRLTAEERRQLTCTCGAWLRPHVLWFDESYDERRFRFHSTLGAIERAWLLVVIGTSGATNLPNLMCERAAARRIPFLVVDPESTSFAALAQGSPRGAFLRGPATEIVPALTAAHAASPAPHK
jgi:NAD-dependent deacetylase